MNLSALFWIVLVLSGIAGCAPGKPSASAPAPPVSTAVATSRGKILAVHKVPPAGAQDPWRAILSPTRATLRPASAGTESPVEFIVRTDDGATLSIVQPSQPGLRAGSRVIVLFGETARLAPAG